MEKETFQAKAIRQSDENMLKTVVLLRMKKGEAHVKDLAEIHNINLTTAYSVVKRLTKNGYIQPLEPHRGGRNSNKQNVILTVEGEALAKKILDRHEIVHSWLLRLGVPYEQADEEACELEHGISDSTMKILEHHVTMASNMKGMEHASADHIMEKIHGAKDSDHQMTVSDIVHEVIEKAGGVEGVKRKSQLFEKVGGESAFIEMAEFIEAIGGAEELRNKKNFLIDLKDLVDSQENIKKIKKLCSYSDYIGGLPALQTTLRELEKERIGVAELKQILELKRIMNLGVNGEETVNRCKVVIKEFGSMDNVVELLECEMKIWKQIYKK